MAPPPPFPKEGDPRLRERQTKARRKQMQMQHEAEYRDALVAQGRPWVIGGDFNVAPDVFRTKADWWLKAVG